MTFDRALFFYGILVGIGVSVLLRTLFTIFIDEWKELSHAKEPQDPVIAGEGVAEATIEAEVDALQREGDQQSRARPRARSRKTRKR